MGRAVPDHPLTDEPVRIKPHHLGEYNGSPRFTAFAGDDYLEADDSLEALLKLLDGVDADVVVWEGFERLAAVVVAGEVTTFRAGDGPSSRPPGGTGNTPRPASQKAAKGGKANRKPPRLLTHDGETLTASEWARRVGMHPLTLFARLNAGWSVEDALTVPVR